MKRILIGAVCVAAMLWTAPLRTANAADLGLKAPPAPPPPAYDWTGFYVGAQAGFGWGSPEFDVAGTAPSYLQNFWYSDGGFGGGMIGGNYEFGKSHIVLGLQGDFNGGSLKGSNTDIVYGAGHTAKLSEFGTGNARLGFALVGTGWDRMLLYVLGGAAYGNPSQTLTKGAVSYNIGGGDKNGWDFGSGVELALTNNWTVRGEWRMYWFTTQSFAPGVFPGTGITTTAGTKETVNTASAGVAYKF